MSISDSVLATSGAYLALCLWLGLRAGKGASASAAGFVAGDRSMGLVLMYFITGATVFSAFAFLGMPGWAMERGAAAYYILGYGTLGFVPFYFTGPRAARLGREYGFVTQAEMVAARFRFQGRELSARGIAGLMALASVLAFVPYLAVQMKGAGMVLEVTSEGRVPSEWGAALVYGIVVIYVFKSGVLGVGWTNTLQGAFMMVLAWVMGLWLPHHLYGGVGPMFDRIAEAEPGLLEAPGRRGDGSPWTFPEYCAALGVSIVGFSFWPHIFMKAFTARSERVLRRTVVLYPTFQVFLVPILLIGFTGVLLEPGPAAPDQVVPHVLMQSGLSPLVIGLFCAGALAASMSSGDAQLHATASIVVRDGWIRCGARALAPERERRAIRALLLPIAVLAYTLAVFYEESLVQLLLYAYGPVGQFAPPVLAALYWRRATGPGVLCGLAAGITVNAWALTQGGLSPYAGLLGLGVNCSLMVCVSLATFGGSRLEEEQRFLDAASRPR